MASARDLPDDIDALKAALLAANDRTAQVEAELAVAKAKASDDQALIAHQQLQIAKLTPRAVRPAFRTLGATARSDGIGFRGAREFGDRG
jgi:hypothetical protein